MGLESGSGCKDSLGMPTTVSTTATDPAPDCPSPHAANKEPLFTLLCYYYSSQPFTHHGYIEYLGKLFTQHGLAASTKDDATTLEVDDAWGMYGDVRADDHDDDDDDDAAAALVTTHLASHPQPAIIVDFYAVYSPVYRVPVLFFRGRKGGGSCHI